MALKALETSEPVVAVDAAHGRPASSRWRLVRNVGYLAGSQLTTWVATLLYTVIVTRAIGPSGNGELSSALAVFNVLTMLVGLGAATYIVKEVARDPRCAPALTSAALAVQGATLLPAAVALWAYLVLSRFGPEMTYVIVLYGVAVVPAVCATTLQSSLQGIQRMGVIAAGGIAANLVFNVAAAALVLFDHASVPLIAILAVVTQTVSLGVSIVGFRRHFAMRWGTSARAMLTLVHEGVPFLATAVAFTLYVAADTIILTVFSSSDEVGWYAAATRLFATLLVVANILGTAWLPRLSAHARDDAGALAREARLLTRFALVSSIPLAVGGALVAPRIVVVLWGTAFSGASGPLVVLLLTLPATSVCMVVYQVLVARDLAGSWARVMAVALAVNVVTNIGLIVWFRSLGGSTALAASLCLAATEYGMAAAAVWMARGQLGLATLFYTVRVLVATAAMGLVVALVTHLPLAAVIVIGAGVFALAAVLVRVVANDELLVVRSLLQRVQHR